MTEQLERRRHLARRVKRTAARLLGRLDGAAGLTALLAVAVGLGTLFPQGAAPDALATRYGERTAILNALGLFRWYETPVVVLLLGMWGAHTVTCTLLRWRGIWRGVRQGKGEATWATLGTHLAVTLVLLGGWLTASQGWRADVTLPVGGMAALGPVTVRLDAFTVDRRPDGSVRDYVARVALTVDGTVAEREVRINAPLVRRGVRLLILRYAETDERRVVTFHLSRDPGYPLVVAGGTLLALCAAVTFYLPPERGAGAEERDG